MSCRVVPAIDLIDGKCVRLRRGDFTTVEVVAPDPIAMASAFRERGFKRLHVVDLSGAKDGVPRHVDVAREIVASTGLEIDYSGGIRTPDQVDEVLRCGVQYVVIGSAAIKRRADVKTWIDAYGADRFIFGLDVRDNTVRVSGWQEDTGISIDEALKNLLELGVTRLMSTDISKDGLLLGPSIDLYERLCQSYPGLRIVASGGVTTAEDIQRLSSVGVSEVIVGKALYSGSISVSNIKEFVW
jgi:phosphoribosylformimino-5-aminoimidazole carboxamide ribotide isomerase